MINRNTRRGRAAAPRPAASGRRPSRGQGAAGVGRSASAARPSSAARTPANAARATANAARTIGAARTTARPANGVRRASGAGRPSRGQGAAGWFRTADHRYSAGKWALVAALVIYCWLMLNANSARDVDFGVIESAMSAAPGLENLDPLGANAAQARLGISPEGCEGWLMYGSGDVMNVSELLVAKARDEALLDSLEAAASARADAQLEVFRSYGPEQAALLERAILWRRGDYLFYGVSDDAEQWEAAFLSCVR